MNIWNIYIHMDIDKITTKIEIKETQLAASDSVHDFRKYNSEMANIRFKEHLEQLKQKVQIINDKPTTMELIYGYISINIGTLIFW